MSVNQMLINYVPGEECRVAIVEDGKLEELFVERHAQASRVGNIYVGKVVNVEPAIQAAFVDFGVEDNGFLHVTDLHPRYFPGEDDETTERVGFKTPRRERPPIQAALRRGDEVIVQVLKEGVGTKGPTVTSYLSIPGRFLVMMPGMDKVGVSRKVEDEDQRRKMREILDQLDLPEGFGFILRTAGFQRNKAELKRDLAYLQRLWKDMDRRLRVGGKPRLLYSESDLLVRSLRDMLTNDISEVIIDSEVALKRASRFMKIVAPRGTTKLLHYPGTTPVFHAFGIENQISLIHAREVPLPSGGRLVIDQTEALVAIDVNSGKSRDARDAEANAYQTNIEAVDEICRQLRLRDMGGIVINDLIDMRHASHRKDIENRFKERLKRDRAKSTVTPISEFGILEMTRQRMRPSHESTHFTDCPTCRGRGLLQRPDSLAGDALRQLAAILDLHNVHKVEMAVAPRVAGELLSTKRALLGRIERSYGKHVDVRVSEAVAVDRVSFYAYDANGADIDVTNLPTPKGTKNLVAWDDPQASADWALSEDEKLAFAEPEPEADEPADTHPIELDEAPDDGSPMPTLEGTGRKRRRRGRRGRGRDGEQGEGGREGSRDGQRRDDRGSQPPQLAPPQNGDQPATDDASERAASDAQEQMQREGLAPMGDPQQGEGGGRRRRRRRGRGRGGRGGEGGPPPRDGQAQSRGDDPRREPSRPQFAENTPDTGGDWGDGFVPSPDAPAAGDEGADETNDAAAPAAARERVMDDHDEAGRDIAATPAPAPLPDDAIGPDEMVAEDDMESEEGGFEDAPAGQPQGEQGEQGEGGGRRRRRRRRRRGGRGGQGGQGGPNNGQAGPQNGQQSGPMQGQQGGSQGGEPRRDDRPRRDQRPRRDDRPREQRPPEPPRPIVEAKPTPPAPAKPAAPATPAAPKIRTLYGAVKRKLSASELNKRPKPE
ncbi:MAG: Rne/Rng family ribonuclease [Tepidisphaera sp.]|nr:Rne/Rng family ribonuclease [Tepidisphaera sp.]